VSVRVLAARFGLAAAVVLAGSTAVFGQSADQTNSITAIVPQTAPAGKLATRTEIIADRGEAAMLSLGSLSAMGNAIGMYRQIAIDGGWPMLKSAKLKKGAKGAAVAALRERLAIEGYLPPDAMAVKNPDRFDATLDKAVKAFQVNHGLAPTGKIDTRTLAELNVPADLRLQTLEINAPRIEAYLQKLGARYILVNIPSAQLEAVNFGTVYSRHNVVVGKRGRPSPTVASTITEINFNPYWNVPVSIVERDLIPKLLKNPNAMAEMRIRVFDKHGGPEVDPKQIDWMTTRADRYFFRQDPGEDNAMATVKINFANPYAVYLHDSPAKQLFGTNARYESSGCVRVDRVQELVNWILDGQDGFNQQRISDIAKSTERLNVRVANAPDLRIMYLTAWATEDGRIQFRPDIYDLDATGFILGQPSPQGGT
jgi:murein L,D-transpeptidase YcbB/YkuD